MRDRPLYGIRRVAKLDEFKSEPHVYLLADDPFAVYRFDENTENPVLLFSDPYNERATDFLDVMDAMSRNGILNEESLLMVLGKAYADTFNEWEPAMILLVVNRFSPILVDDHEHLLTVLDNYDNFGHGIIFLEDAGIQNYFDIFTRHSNPNDFFNLGYVFDFLNDQGLLTQENQDRIVAMTAAEVAGISNLFSFACDPMDINHQQIHQMFASVFQKPLLAGFLYKAMESLVKEKNINSEYFMQCVNEVFHIEESVDTVKFLDNIVIQLKSNKIYNPATVHALFTFKGNLQSLEQLIRLIDEHGLYLFGEHGNSFEDMYFFLVSHPDLVDSVFQYGPEFVNSVRYLNLNKCLNMLLFEILLAHTEVVEILAKGMVARAKIIERIVDEDKLASSDSAAIIAWVMNDVSVNADGNIVSGGGLDVSDIFCLAISLHWLDSPESRQLTLWQELIHNEKYDLALYILNYLQENGLLFSNRDAARMILGGSPDILSDLMIMYVNNIFSKKNDPALNRLLENVLEMTQPWHDASDAFQLAYELIRLEVNKSRQGITLTDDQKKLLLHALKNVRPETIQAMFPGRSLDFYVAHELLHENICPIPKRDQIRLIQQIFLRKDNDLRSVFQTLERRTSIHDMEEKKSGLRKS